MDLNLLKDRKGKVNAILKEIKSENITGTNRFNLGMIHLYGRKSRPQTKEEKMLRDNPGGKEYINQYIN